MLVPETELAALQSANDELRKENDELEEKMESSQQETEIKLLRLLEKEVRKAGDVSGPRYDKTELEWILRRLDSTRCP